MPLTDKDAADLKRLIKAEMDAYPDCLDCSRRGG